MRSESEVYVISELVLSANRMNIDNTMQINISYSCKFPSSYCTTNASPVLRHRHPSES